MDKSKLFSACAKAEILRNLSQNDLSALEMDSDSIITKALYDVMNGYIPCGTNDKEICDNFTVVIAEAVVGKINDGEIALAKAIRICAVIAAKLQLSMLKEKTTNAEYQEPTYGEALE